jgi:hypothetical protein
MPTGGPGPAFETWDSLHSSPVSVLFDPQKSTGALLTSMRQYRNVSCEHSHEAQECSQRTSRGHA